MRVLEGWRRANVWAAAAGCCLTLLAVVTSFLPGAPYVPESVVMTLFVLVFPIFGAAFLREMIPVERFQRAQGKRRWWQPSIDRALMRRLLAPIPVSVRVGIVVLFFGLWLAGMSANAGPAGQPFARDGRYFLNNHSIVTEISREEYERALAYWTRGFASGASAFYALAAVLSRYGPLLQPESGPRPGP